MPGAERPFIGNVPEFAKYDRTTKSSGEPLSDVNIWLLENLIDANKEGGYKPENHKAILMNLFGKSIMQITDIDMVQDLVVNKNKLIDKLPTIQQIFEDIAPNAFMF